MPWSAGMRASGVRVLMLKKPWKAQQQAASQVRSVCALTRLGSELDDLRSLRETLVSRVRALADRLADPDKPRVFNKQHFESQEQ